MTWTQGSDHSSPIKGLIELPRIWNFLTLLIWIKFSCFSQLGKFSKVPTFLFFFFFSWRLITLQYCSGFCHTLKESAMDLYVFPIPIPSPTSLSTQSLWVFPVHQVWALVPCIQPGMVICFTLDNIHVLMLFSWNIPPSPSPTESKSLFYTSVSLFLFCI